MSRRVDPYRFGATDYSFTKLLIGAEGANNSTVFTDESSAPHALTANGNVKITTTSPLVGTSSILMDGAGDWISAADSVDWTFGTEDFTVDLWVKPDNNNPANAAFLGQWGGTVTNCSWFLFKDSGNLLFRYYDAGANVRTLSVAYFLTNTEPTHIRVDRAGAVLRLYAGALSAGSAAMLAKVDHSSVGGPQALNMQDGTGVLGIGAIPSLTGGVWDFQGRFDEVRILKGRASCGSDSGYVLPSGAWPRS